MKFLLEFASCCGSRSDKGQEEARSLVPQEMRRLAPEEQSPRRRKRVRLMRVRGGGGGGGDEWRPTLFSISEDNVVVEKVDKGSQRDLKRKKLSISKDRANHYREHVGRASLSSMMPELSPTPFLV